ncbi:MAG TPA: FecR domain-containing protein [Burkholderiales bacterium]|nr:FecR domain-containing protein [Burkholderiales bacterium]
MKFTTKAILAAAASLASLAAPAQEIAGRVVVSAGDVFIMRGVERIPASFGTQIRAGDQIELGKQSNAQVLFTDQSVVALRSETSFKVQEYEFQGRPAPEQKTLFSLLKGGMRTVTGLIGRVNQKNYAVVTPTATVGIRGTNYTLVQCDGNCRNPNGTAAPSGTYGAVTDGRIGVTNQSGERTFGADQYFHVASQTSAPTQLIAPPQFLRDTLEGRARAKERQQEQAQARAQGQQGQQQQQQQQQTSSSGSSASTTTVASADDSHVTSSLTSSTVPVALTTNVYQSTTAASVTGPSTVITPGTTGTIFYHLDSLGGPFNIPVTNCGGGSCSNITGGSFTLSVNLALQRAYLKADFTGGGDFNTGTPFSSGGIPITVNGGQIVFNGSFNRSDFPNEQGAFKCFNCNNTSGVAFLDTISVSGVINGSQATLSFTGTGSQSSGSFTTTLSQQTPPNNLAAAALIPLQNSFGYVSTSNAYWGVTVNSSGQLVQIGLPGVGGTGVGQIGSATNTTVITATLSDGSTMTGGFWGNSGATVTDNNFATFVTGSGTVPNQPVPWIVGTATNTLPVSLGSSVNYTPVAAVVSNGTGTLNSALLTADFVNQKVAANINASNAGGATFQMNGTSGISAVSGRFSASFSQVTCTGTCPGGSPTGGFAGFFAGKNAEGAGLAFTAGTGSTSVSGVMGLKR